MSKTTVIHHSADFDGLFCREIARKSLPDAELIGWDYGQPKIPVPLEGALVRGRHSGKFFWSHEGVHGCEVARPIFFTDKPTAVDAEKVFQ